MGGKLGRLRGRRTRIASSVAAMVAVVVTTLVGVSAPAHALPCLINQTGPLLQATTVNQGLGSYDLLVQGKKTLVRVYLTKQNCDQPEIELLDATLTVNNGTVPAPVVRMESPPPTNGYFERFPTFGTKSADHPTHPLFMVPPAATKAGSISFSASVTWRTVGSTNNQTATFNVPVRSFVVTNALRLLVVPMGDANARSTQYPTDADQAVQNGMLTTSRILPVGDGVGDLVGGTGGVRYKTLTDTLLNLGTPPKGSTDGFDPPMVDAASGKVFCPTNADWQQRVAPKLGWYLSDWNAKNPGAKADLVVGAIWEGISDDGCAQGLANVPSSALFVRAISDRTDRPSTTGALIAHESLHALNLRHTNSDGEFHSPNARADVVGDPTSEDRGYHVVAPDFVSAPRSVMRLSTGWHNHSAILEKSDWAHAVCVLGGSLTGCDTGSTPGSVGTSQAGSALVVSGWFDDTNADVQSYWTPSSERSSDAPADQPHAVVIQKDEAGVEVARQRIAVSRSTVHESNDAHVASGEAWNFQALVPSVSAPGSFELRTSDGRLVWSRLKGTAPQVQPPTVEPVPTTERRHTTDGKSKRPSVSPDGALVAWATSSGIVVGPTSDSEGSNPQLDLSVPLPNPVGLGGIVVEGAELDPSWDVQGRNLVYVLNGDVYVTRVDYRPGDPLTSDSFSPPRKIYDAAMQGIQPWPARYPSFNRTAMKIAVQLQSSSKGQHVFVIDLGFGTLPTCALNEILPGCRPIGSSDAAGTPAFSRSGSERVAYVSGGATRIHDIAAGQVVRTVTGVAPAWSPNRLYTSSGGTITSVDASSYGAPATVTGSGATDPSPTDADNLVAFTRSGSGKTDVWLASTGRRIYRVGVTHPDLSIVRGDFWVDCGSSGGVRPIAANLRPVVVDGVGYFVVEHDPSGTCTAGTVRFQATSGILTSEATVGTAGAASPPVPTIYVPSAGADLLESRTFSTLGTARDNEQGVVGGPALAWYITPAGGTPALLGTGPSVPSIRKPPGHYEITLRATDASGLVGQTSVEVDVLVDEDGDYMIQPIETQPCFPPGADRDPANANADYDGDGILNVDDAMPCRADRVAPATTNFDPDTFNPWSTGTPVTITFTVPDRDLSTVDPGTVRIIRVVATSDTGERMVYDADLRALRWSIDRKGNGVAQFDRVALGEYLRARKLTGRTVAITAEGAAPTFTFEGFDPSSPYVQS